MDSTAPGIDSSPEIIDKKKTWTEKKGGMID